MKLLLTGAAQVIVLIGFARVMNLVSNGLGLPIPGSILGILVLYGLLQARVVKVEWIEVGAAWLLAEMLLFLIPPAVGIMQYGDLIRSAGLQLLVAVIGSMLAVMIVSGLLSERLSLRSERRSGKQGEVAGASSEQERRHGRPSSESGGEGV